MFEAGIAALVVKIYQLKERAFAAAFRYGRNRITAFIALPIKNLDRISLAKRLCEIGKLEGSTYAREKA